MFFLYTWVFLSNNHFAMQTTDMVQCVLRFFRLHDIFRLQLPRVSKMFYNAVWNDSELWLANRISAITCFKHEKYYHAVKWVWIDNSEQCKKWASYDWSHVPRVTLDATDVVQLQQQFPNIEYLQTKYKIECTQACVSLQELHIHGWPIRDASNLMQMLPNLHTLAWDMNSSDLSQVKQFAWPPKLQHLTITAMFPFSAEFYAQHALPATVQTLTYHVRSFAHQEFVDWIFAVPVKKLTLGMSDFYKPSVTVNNAQLEALHLQVAPADFLAVSPFVTMKCAQAKSISMNCYPCNSMLNDLLLHVALPKLRKLELGKIGYMGSLSESQLTDTCLVPLMQLLHSIQELHLFAKLPMECLAHLHNKNMPNLKSFSASFYCTSETSGSTVAMASPCNVRQLRLFDYSNTVHTHITSDIFPHLHSIQFVSVITAQAWNYFVNAALPSLQVISGEFSRRLTCQVQIPPAQQQLHYDSNRKRPSSAMEALFQLCKIPLINELDLQVPNINLCDAFGSFDSGDICVYGKCMALRYMLKRYIVPDAAHDFSCKRICKT